jgi:hypothetical protein
MLKSKYTIPLTILTSWALLGFKRGIDYYDYNYNRQNIYMKDNVKHPYLYSSRIFEGLIGSFIYINPVLWPIVICKEIFRLEVNIRGMDDLKKEYHYNSLL